MAGFVIWLEAVGRGTLTGHGAGHLLWHMVAGPGTAVPLPLFGAAARLLPLSLLGVLQYLTPTLHFAWGVLVIDEAMSAGRWIGFGLIWSRKPRAWRQPDQRFEEHPVDGRGRQAADEVSDPVSSHNVEREERGAAGQPHRSV